MTNKERNQELLRIVAENPDLPIVAMVDSDVVCEDNGWWLASFGNVEVGEYALYDDEYFDDRDSFKERYYERNDDELCERFNFNPFIRRGNYTKEQLAANDEADKELEKYLDELAEKHFKKAIIVYVGLPDDLE